MFTRGRWRPPSFTGDWAKDGPEVLKSINDYWLALEQKQALSIDEAVIRAALGIKFPASQGAASTDANTLDDYEEESWTPTLIGQTTAGTQTYASQVGRYTKIGRLVFLHDCRIALSAKGGTMAGNVVVGGLPFASRNTGGVLVGSISIGAFNTVDLSAGYSYLGLLVPSASSVLNLAQSGDNVATGLVQAAAIANDTVLTFSGAYEAA